MCLPSPMDSSSSKFWPPYHCLVLLLLAGEYHFQDLNIPGSMTPMRVFIPARGLGSNFSFWNKGNQGYSLLDDLVSWEFAYVLYGVWV
jgi:hypothetical protein